ncbi:hypothetical protein IP88_05655 [alpha proteobacterium AAP81b]|nr:hypothetical protein IP88_05655 [alpha proteobacterium AAP81b]
MDADQELPPPRRWPLVLAIIATLVWLAATTITYALPLLDVAVPAEAWALVQPAGTALAMAAPLALLWLLWAQLRDSIGARATRVTLMAEHANFTAIKLDHGAMALADLEQRLDTLVARIDTVGEPLRQKHERIALALSGLEAAGVRLSSVAGQTEAAAATLARATPDAAAEAERLTALLTTAETTLQSQLASTAALLDRLHARAAEVEAQGSATTQAIREGLEAVSAASTRAEAALQAPLGDLNARVDAAFARTAQAMDATRDGVHAQTSAMLASVDQARVTLDHIGGEAARQITTRLQSMLDLAAQLSPAIEAQAGRSNALIDELARGFTVLDTKLGNSASTGNATLDAITARMTEAREAIHRLGEPIAATTTALGGVEARLAAVSDLAGDALGALGEVGGQIATLDTMAARIADLHDRAEALQAPLSAGGNSLVSARGLLDDARGSLDAATAQLGEQLASAREALVEIEQLTGSASLAASSQLIDVFGRVRDVAQQTAGTMRETLAKVVDEAEAALGAAGEARAASAFGTPIKAQLAEIEATHDRVAAAAQGAAERVTARLVGLMASVSEVEARIDKMETGFDVRARGTLARRSKALVESLQRAAVDFAGLLSFDVEDGDWDAYLKGDRSIFTRRVLARMEGDGNRAIGRHFQHDAEFRAQATQFIDEFEALIGQVMSDRDGQSLATALLGSHIGRLYLAIAQGAGRFAD